METFTSSHKANLGPANLTLVVPCFNEEAVLRHTADLLSKTLAELIAAGLIGQRSCVCFVDDGSSDQTWTFIEELSRESERFRGLKLTRNSGHQAAVLAGLLHVQGDIVISIDADLQDDLNAIQKMVAAYYEGSDIVFGVRINRESDSIFKRATAQYYYRLLGYLHIEVVYNHADFRLMSRRAIESLRRFDEINLFLRALVLQLGFKTSTVTYKRQERIAGETKYSLPKMVSLAIEGITSFSSAPLRGIALFGLLVSLISFLLTIWAGAAALIFKTTIPGWASTVMPIYFICGVQMLFLGIIGEYVGKIYMETKRRPRFIIEQTTGNAFDQNEAIRS